MIIVNQDSMSVKTAGPLGDPDLLLPPPPYQQVDIYHEGPSTRPRELSFSSSGGEPSTPSPWHPSPYLSVPTHRRDYSTASTRSLSPYAPSHDDSLTRFASTPALILPSSPVSDAGFARAPSPNPAARRLRGTSRGFQFPISSDGLTALLSPPPPSFERPRAVDVPYTPFESTSLLGISTDLTRSFPRMAPPCASGSAHPFATHDVTEQDWSRFLRDIEAASALSKWERIMARIHMPSLLGLKASVGLVVKGIEVYMHNRRRGPVGELVGYWNHHFFHPRHIHVVLARGIKAYSGADPHPPDMPVISEDEPESERDRKLKEFEAECPKCWRLVVAYRP